MAIVGGGFVRMWKEAGQVFTGSFKEPGQILHPGTFGSVSLASTVHQKKKGHVEASGE